MLVPIDPTPLYDVPAQPYHLAVLDRLDRLANSERDDWPIGDLTLGQLPTEDVRDIVELGTVDSLTHLENIWLPAHGRQTTGNKMIKLLQAISSRLLNANNRLELDISIEGLHGYCHNSVGYQTSGRHPVKPHEHLLAYIQEKADHKRRFWRFTGNAWREVYNPDDDATLNRVMEDFVSDYLHDSLVGLYIHPGLRQQVHQDIVVRLARLCGFSSIRADNRHKLERAAGWLTRYATNALRLPP